MTNEDIKNLTRLPRCDYVINLAAESHVANSIDDSTPFIESNVEGVKNLLELIRQTRGDRRPLFFHVSTDEVYGDIDEGKFTETSLLNPSNPYSASKAAADMLILAWSRTYDIEYNIIRPTNFYGKGQFPEKLIPLTIENFERGLKIPLHNNGAPIRTWLHITDACQAIFTILEKGQKNEIYNCSGGFEQTNKETVTKIIKSYYGDDANINDYVDYSLDRPGQDVRYALEDNKLRDLGWQTQRKFDEEIVNIVKYHKGKFVW
jgi:dTDP-glucose 4,6-dehydratase